MYHILTEKLFDPSLWTTTSALWTTMCGTTVCWSRALNLYPAGYTQYQHLKAVLDEDLETTCPECSLLLLQYRAEGGTKEYPQGLTV